MPIRINCQHLILLCGVTLLLGLHARSAAAQRVRFGSTDGGPLPTTYATPPIAQPGSVPSTTVPNAGGWVPANPVGNPVTSAAPQIPAVAQAPGIGVPPPGYPPAAGFDPFAGPASPIIGPPPSASFPTTSPGLYPSPNAQPWLMGTGQYQGYPGIPSQPSTLFPNWQPSGASWPTNALANLQTGPYFKVIQDLRLIHTWIPGGEGNVVDINQSVFGVTMNYPDFLASRQPLRISPGLALDFWDGPSPPVLLADMPAAAYGAYVDFDWMTDPQNPFGGEVNFRPGIYSDFNSLTTDSLMFRGTGLGRFRITPNLAVKFGITYLDRVRVKMLPAGGIFWRPTEDTNIELYFPRPKIARRLSKVGESDVWGYIGAEYGGGSWTIERRTGLGDQVDINDIRLFLGADWTTIRDKRGFLEVGYVFKRELQYRYNVSDNIRLEDGLMIRGGLSF